MAAPCESIWGEIQDNILGRSFRILEVFGKSNLHVEIWFEPQSSLLETSAEILININYSTKLSWYGKLQIIHFSFGGKKNVFWRIFQTISNISSQAHCLTYLEVIRANSVLQNRICCQSWKAICSVFPLPVAPDIVSNPANIPQVFSKG